jgi:hypothetical protein
MMWWLIKKRKHESKRKSLYENDKSRDEEKGTRKGAQHPKKIIAT